MKYFTSMLPKIFCQYNFISDSVRKLWIANNVCWPKKGFMHKAKRKHWQISIYSNLYNWSTTLILFKTRKKVSIHHWPKSTWIGPFILSFVFRLCRLNSPVDMNLLGDCWSTTTPPCLCPLATGKWQVLEREARLNMLFNTPHLLQSICKQM